MDAKELDSSLSQWLSGLTTPCLLVDRARLAANAARMMAVAARLGVRLRPHLKTVKCLEAAKILCGGAPGPIAVSTLAEAVYFAANGFSDILYTVGISPQKLDQVAGLRGAGIDLSVVLDSLTQAEAIVRAARRHAVQFSVYLEINCDDHRGGIDASDPGLLVLARRLADAGIEIKGVMTHAGSAYEKSPHLLREVAAMERAAAVNAVARLRLEGIEVPVASVGSTPTAISAEALDGVSEIRTGVHAFMDLTMVDLGVCRVDDIAVSVLATVIGYYPQRNRILIDAGWTAMSRDRGTERMRGFGLVADLSGRAYDGIVFEDTNQEHGILALDPSADAPANLPIGSLVRVFPNHACATASQFARYHILGTAPGEPKVWHRLSAAGN